MSQSNENPSVRLTFVGGPKDGTSIDWYRSPLQVGYFYANKRDDPNGMFVGKPLPGMPALRYRLDPHKNAEGELVYYFVGIETITPTPPTPARRSAE